MKRWTLPLSLVLGALTLLPGQVSAHAGYARSEPAQNAVVPSQPVRVDVWFTQEVFKQEGSNFVRVFNDQDVQVSDGDGVVDDDDREHMYTTLQQGLADGRYIVRWMTTSDEDGDDDDGAFCFYISVQPTAAQEAECASFAGPGETPGATSSGTQPAAGSPTSPSVAPTATAVSGSDNGDDDGPPTAAIVAGVIVGGVVLVLVVGGVVVWLRRTLA